MNDEFDFGFTLVDESELEAVQRATTAVAATSTEVEQLQRKLDKLYNAVQPLLANLKANPEKEYILWKDRVAKVDAFSDHLYNIYKA
jgi:acetolactate synthase small subunit